MAQPAWQLVWFKRDLRAVDHPALAQAARQGPVLPLYIVEPELWRAADGSARQYGFHAACAATLGATLASLGQPLVVRVGNALDVLRDLHARHSIGAIWAHQETTQGLAFARDRAVRAWARGVGLPFHEPRQNGVVRALQDRDGWARQWQRTMNAPLAEPPRVLTPLGLDPGALPTADELGLAPDPCPGRQKGGRATALALLDGFLAGRGRDYRRAMASPLDGEWACSRLSAHLAAGSVSLREVHQAASAARQALANEPEAAPLRASLASFMSRLAWRDHFTQKLESEPALETSELHPSLRALDRHGPDHPHFAAWAEGRTGWPFLDACMRSLAATGWLNFRMRAMLVSVATGHLWLDWRAVGQHLARLFTDYEAGIHWPQVQMQSGVTGVNTVRLYNPVKQGFDQDCSGAFIRRYVPELAHLPAPAIHTPWLGDVRAEYPAPIVDHEAAARVAREKLWGARHGPAYRAAAAAIQAKHGSRKSGLKPTLRRPARKAAPAQQSLDL
jgi:deoxyribodipyrimidine photo-lyase